MLLSSNYLQIKSLYALKHLEIRTLNNSYILKKIAEMKNGNESFIILDQKFF